MFSLINSPCAVNPIVQESKPGLVPKLSAPRTGPHTVTAIYTNGTVRIQRGVVNERVNIRRLTPYLARAQSN
jgi:hypothetical protein